MSLNKYKVAALVAGACLSALPAVSSQAVVITADMVPNATGPTPITAAQLTNAIADDTAAGTAGAPGPRLAGTVTYDLIIHFTASSAGGDGWASADAAVGLSTGSFYNASFVQPDPNDPQPEPDGRVANPATWAATPNRHYRADTFVTSPTATSGFGATTLLGAFLPQGASPTFSPQLTNVSWGPNPTSAVFNTGATRDVVIGRFTVTANAIGTFSIQVAGTSNNNTPFKLTGTIPIGNVPEPTSAALLAGGLGLIATRRRRQA